MVRKCPHLLVKSSVANIVENSEQLPIVNLKYPRWFLKTLEKQKGEANSDEDRIEEDVFKTEGRINFPAGAAE